MQQRDYSNRGFFSNRGFCMTPWISQVGVNPYPERYSVNGYGCGVGIPDLSDTCAEPYTPWIYDEVIRIIKEKIKIGIYERSILHIGRNGYAS